MNELLDTAELEQVLRELGEDVRQGYMDELLQHDRKATGTLLDSVTAIVDVQGEVYEVKLQLADYWKYVEEWSAPHWPPRKAILDWIKAKPVIPRPDSKGRIPSQESLAFLISRKIARVGTEGSHDLERAIDAVNREYRDKLVIALSQDTDTLMKVIVGEIRGSLTQG